MSRDRPDRVPSDVESVWYGSAPPSMVTRIGTIAFLLVELALVRWCLRKYDSNSKRSMVGLRVESDVVYDQLPRIRIESFRERLEEFVRDRQRPNVGLAD